MHVVGFLTDDEVFEDVASTRPQGNIRFSTIPGAYGYDLGHLFKVNIVVRHPVDERLLSNSLIVMSAPYALSDATTSMGTFEFLLLLPKSVALEGLAANQGDVCPVVGLDLHLAALVVASIRSNYYSKMALYGSTYLLYRLLYKHSPFILLSNPSDHSAAQHSYFGVIEDENISSKITTVLSNILSELTDVPAFWETWPNALET